VELARRVMLGALGIAIVGAVWWLLSTRLDPVRLPSPFTVLATLRDDWSNIPALLYVSFQAGGIRDAVVYTAVNVMMGVAIGTAIGFPLGALLGRSRLAREVLAAPLVVLTTVPVLTLLPFLTMWFGTSRIVQAGLVIIFATVTVAAVAQNATSSLAEHVTDYAASLGAGPRMIMREVVLPATVPAVVGAVRVAAAAGWSFESVSELLGGNHGAGKLIQTMQGMSATPDIMATILALGGFAVVVDAAIAAAGRWAVRWQE
jgi:ABC-type nitrate/sulfonate/bicarbonate transport system permease component